MEQYTNKDKWRVTLEIDTLDGDPWHWNWKVFFPNDEVRIRRTDLVGRATEECED